MEAYASQVRSHEARPRDLEVPRVTAALEKRVAVLREVTDDLITRLAPLMRHDQEVSPGDVSSEPRELMRSPFAASLSEIEEGLGFIARRLREVLDRMEL